MFKTLERILRAGCCGLVVNEGEIYACKKCRREVRVLNPGLSNSPPICCEHPMALFE